MELIMYGKFTTLQTILFVLEDLRSRQDRCVSPPNSAILDWTAIMTLRINYSGFMRDHSIDLTTSQFGRTIHDNIVSLSRLVIYESRPNIPAK